MSQKVTQKQFQAIHLLASGKKTTEVAAELKLRRETLSRWKQLPEFQEAFEEVMEEERDRLRHRMTLLVDAALTRIDKTMTNGYWEPEYTGAALNVLKLLGFDRLLLPKSSNHAQTQPNNAKMHETQAYINEPAVKTIDQTPVARPNLPRATLL